MAANSEQGILSAPLGTPSTLSGRRESQQQLRVGRPADQRGIWRWLPGLYTLRHYRPDGCRGTLRRGWC